MSRFQRAVKLDAGLMSEAAVALFLLSMTLTQAKAA